MKKHAWMGICICFAIATSVLAHRLHTVAQKDRKFTVQHLEIARGDIVSFPNLDPFFHNVYSLSPARTFDLGSYPKGETRRVTFEKTGKVEVRCAIHPDMKMTITVR